MDGISLRDSPLTKRKMEVRSAEWIELFDLVLCKIDACRVEVFFLMLRVERHRDRDDVWLVYEPGQRDLIGTRLMFWQKDYNN